jgi:putative ABC transport system ATP-binding protein
MALARVRVTKEVKAGLVVTHDPRLFGFADRIVYIEDGTLRRQQSTDLSPADAQQR